MNARRMTRQALPGGHDVERTGDGLGAKLVTTGMAWLVVYLLLLTLFSSFEDQLAALTLPVRLLVVSGVLVIVMANLVMPMVIRMSSLRGSAERSIPRPVRVTKRGQRSTPTGGSE
jgi:multidrug efflux pump subunit AcrB